MLSSAVGPLLLSLVLFPMRPTICIDPGHPSEVGDGTKGDKITEMKLVWQIASVLAWDLRAEGYNVVLTKTREREFVTNRNRASIANQAHSDLMVRLHCDASSGTGFTVYYPDRQGISHGYRGPTYTVLSRTKTAARVFHGALAASLGSFLRDNGLQPDVKTAIGCRQGALTGSIFSAVPVVLVEMCVLTNPHDEVLLCGPIGRKRMISGLLSGVEAAIPLASRLGPRFSLPGNPKDRLRRFEVAPLRR